MKKIFLLFVLSIMSSAFADIDIQKIIEKRPQPDMYSATLVTTISGSMLKSAQQTRSTIYVKGTAFRSDTETPTKTITISKGAQSWIIGPDGSATEIKQEKSDITNKGPE